MKISPVFFPFLFALFVVLNLFAFNINLVPTNQVFVPLIITVFSTLILWAGLSPVFKDKNKSGLFVFLFLFHFFSYLHFQIGLTLTGFEFGKDKYLLPITGIMLLLEFYLVKRTRSNLHKYTLFLNFVTTFLVISSLVRIVPYEFKRQVAKQKLSQASKIHSFENIEQLETPLLETASLMPDIYYIIFDRYASADILKTFFDYDNSEFIDYLTEKGFFVASESQTNYPKTFLSLASSLNMNHLDSLMVVKDLNDHTLVYKMLQDYRVWRFLKARGYKFVHIGDYWDPTSTNPFADMNINYNPLGHNGFSILLLRTTALNPVVEMLIGDQNTQNRTRILYKFERLADIPEIEGPKFIFAHMLIPHEPYVFGPNGEPLTKEETLSKNEVENYINQLIFTNKQIKLLIDELLSKSDPDPIIVLQSDEGPLITPEFLSAEFSATSDWSRVSSESLRTHLKILNAYYLPNLEKNTLYNSITPVNSFRIVFNLYFGTNYELLDDTSYISEGSNLPYNFVKITADLPRN